MKEKKSKRVIVRITESQFKDLIDCVIEENNKKYTTSDLIRESVIEKLKKIKDDAKRKK
ncbi:hypothetical protein OAM52_04280 [Flavobacteriaceae bacterium]|jgi:hypothetical protein|uniref:hypothetical protein n=1 Tax=Polaribacter marinivivus TaxID=1524260 RepID=UPI002339CB01|nr:hypothetical protein [uncultured Polaribacter sp.]MDB2612187.1 hypothetical protein [Flavobacteriaceae bacterium]MDB4401879.1 hypothetical protein [Algibacter sp.]MDC1519889.1 hypothetical protein [Polaribacter sp.]MDB4642827.1 hypothetical protein [Flavobacteriaceae bacterium]MDC0380870.1 hypothetical protein [Flavobacteriaceae bacterium]